MQETKQQQSSQQGQKIGMQSVQHVETKMLFILAVSRLWQKVLQCHLPGTTEQYQEVSTMQVPPNVTLPHPAPSPPPLAATETPCCLVASPDYVASPPTWEAQA